MAPMNRMSRLGWQLVYEVCSCVGQAQLQPLTVDCQSGVAWVNIQIPRNLLPNRRHTLLRTILPKNDGARVPVYLHPDPCPASWWLDLTSSLTG